MMQKPSKSLRRRGGVVLVLLLLSIFLMGLLSRDQMVDGLIYATGETEPERQLVALFRNLFEPQLDTADLASIAHAGVNPYGANTFFEQEVEEWKLRKSMEMLREAGVRWVRQQIPWSDIEIPQKGLYQNPYGTTWDKYDRFIDLARQYGLEIVARLDDPPNWSRQDNAVHNRPPDNLEDYGDFVYTFVKRYQGRIRYYQIWNEPNIYPEWGNRPVDAAGYVELLKVGYARAKQADPGVIIIAAALAPTLGTPDGYNESDLTFLQGMYGASARNYFDILSVMGYGLWTGPGDRRAEPGRVNFSRIRLIRETMVRNGDAQKPIWVSELGWNALPLDFPKPPTHGRVSEELQARYTLQAYQRAQEEWPWMGVLFYWHFRMVHDENRDQVMFYFRMLDPDFTPHPVYNAYKEMANAPSTLSYGFHQEEHWALEYKGDWSTSKDERAVLGAYRAASGPGASLSFRFRGTGLELVTRRGPGGGRLSLEIDGASRGQIELEAPQEEWQARVPLARGLRDGVHTVRIVAEGRRVVIDGVIVERSPLYLWRLGLGLLLALGLLGALVSLRR